MTAVDESEPMDVLKLNEETIPTLEPSSDCEESNIEDVASESLVPTNVTTATAQEASRGEGEGGETLGDDVPKLDPDSESNASQPLEPEEQEGKIVTDFATQRRMDQEQEIQASSKEIIEPLKLLKKGATAVIGGTMVGVGLVMIPLPTPCGCVVASSGLAILGSEFEGAKRMNDKLVDSTKSNLVKARDSMINKIQSMNSGDESSDEEPDTEGEEESPSWLNNMNPVERKRQEKLLKEKYRKENQSSNEQLREYMLKTTGSFLSRTILPVLNRTKGFGAAASDTASPLETEAEAASEQNQLELQGNGNAEGSVPNDSEKDNLEGSFEIIDVNEGVNASTETSPNADEGNAKLASI